MAHPLRGPDTVTAIEHAASEHLGHPWVSRGFADLTDRASHPCGVLRGQPFSVFAKFSGAADARDQFTGELAGLQTLTCLAHIPVPVPVADGVVEFAEGCLLLFEALPEVLPQDRSRREWRSIGQVLATLHGVTNPQFGLGEQRGFFGPLPQDNRPVPANRWSDFYRERRIDPLLRGAVDSGHLPSELAVGVDRIADRLPDITGPDPQPKLLHGDAQQNNFVTAAAAAVVIDAAPTSATPSSTSPCSTSSSPYPATSWPPTTRSRRSTRASPNARNCGGCRATSPSSPSMAAAPKGARPSRN